MQRRRHILPGLAPLAVLTALAVLAGCRAETGAPGTARPDHRPGEPPGTSGGAHRPDVVLLVADRCPGAGAPRGEDPPHYTGSTDPDRAAAILLAGGLAGTEPDATRTPSFAEAFARAGWTSVAVLRRLPGPRSAPLLARFDRRIPDGDADRLRWESVAPLSAIDKAGEGPVAAWVELADCPPGASTPPGLAELVRALAAREREGPAVVGFTALRGNEGGTGPGGSLAEAAIRVPWRVLSPATPSPAAELTRAQDVLPTLMALAGVNPPGKLAGVDLASASPGLAVVLGDGALALVQPPLKLVRAGERTALYDLRDDPGERRDLAALLPEEAARLGRVLAHSTRDLEPTTPATATDDGGLDADTLEELRSLGYVQ